MHTAYRRRSNYIFILDLTSGFKGFSKDSRKTVRESFKCWHLVRLILGTWRYIQMKSTIMFPMNLNILGKSGVPGRFIEYSLRYLHRTLMFICLCCVYKECPQTIAKISRNIGYLWWFRAVATGESIASGLIVYIVKTGILRRGQNKISLQMAQRHFIARKLLYFNWIFTEVCSKGCSLQYVTIVSSNGFAKDREHHRSSVLMNELRNLIIQN